jgi:di/tricarboxylate transporter
MVAGLALIALRVVTRTEAREAVDIEVVVAIAASFGLGNAIEASGLAGAIADGMVAAIAAWGDLAVLGAVLVTTIVLTELITNNAAAVLMFPIAMAAAAEAGLDPRPFAFAVAAGASMSFLTPIGYQTNTIVYGLGGYRFADFVRLGSLLTPPLIIVALVVIPIAWPLHP